jgi:hypothetical protein
VIEDAFMRKTNVSLSIALSVLCACGGPAAPPQAATPPAGGSTPTADVPLNGAFLGRVWIATTPGSARGSMVVFLPDRTLLMDSCFETFRLTKWGVARQRIRWLEDIVPLEADVSMPSPNELTLQIVGQDRPQTYVAASVPYVCPDMPR